MLAGAGVFFALDLIFWHHAIEDVGAGLATVLGNMQVVVVAFAAWMLLGERPGARVVAAVPIVMSGVVLISGVLEEGAYGDDPARGVVFGVLTSITYAGFFLLLRQANTGARRPAGPLFEATAVSALVCLVYGELAGVVDLTPGLEPTAWLVTLGLTSQVLGWMLISVSLPALSAALGAGGPVRAARRVGGAGDRAARRGAVGGPARRGGGGARGHRRGDRAADAGAPIARTLRAWSRSPSTSSPPSPACRPG